MTVSDAIKVIEIIFKANNPLVTIPGLFIIVTILFAVIHKFIRTRYIEDRREFREENREEREQFKQIDSSLRAEIDRLTKRLDEVLFENETLKIIIDKTKDVP